MQVCDLAVHLPLERELCPFDLAPVTSTAIQMIFGDTVAIALMQVGLFLWCLALPALSIGTPGGSLHPGDWHECPFLVCLCPFIPTSQAKHLTRDQYAMNHPAGRIGKRLMLRVADVMVR